MSIEELVKKYIKRNGWSFSHDGECADAIRAALTEQAAEHERKQALLLEAHCERVSSLQERIRELEALMALMVPGGFPSDVMTAAGLVYHGKRDKVLAERLRIGAQSMLAAAPELLEALELLMKYSARPSCESLHHDKKYRHTALEPCPAEVNLYQARIMAEDAIAKAKGETK